MVNPNWSKDEEQVYWKTLIPKGPKAIGIDKLRGEPKTWKDLAEEMTRIMGPKAKRKYGPLGMFEHFFQNVVNERYSPNAPKYAVKYVKKYKEHYGETPRGLRKQGKYIRDAPEPAAFEQDKNKTPQRKPLRPRVTTARARAAAINDAATNGEKEARSANEGVARVNPIDTGDVPAMPKAAYAAMENTAYDATSGPVGTTAPAIPVEYDGKFQTQLNEALSELEEVEYDYGVFKPTGPTEQNAAEALALLKQGRQGNAGTETAPQLAASHHQHAMAYQPPDLQHVPGYHPAHYNYYAQQYAIPQQQQEQQQQQYTIAQQQQQPNQSQQQHQMLPQQLQLQHQHGRVPAGGQAHTVYGYHLTGQAAAPAPFEYPPTQPQGGYFHCPASEQQHIGYFDHPNTEGYAPSLTDGSTVATPSDNTTNQNYQGYWFSNEYQYASHVNNPHYSADRKYEAEK